MRYLLDTHTLIWYLEGAPRLPKKTKEFMDNNADHICLCAPYPFGRGKRRNPNEHETTQMRTRDDDIVAFLALIHGSKSR